MTPEEWESTIRGPAHRVFGLFDAGRLIGITAVFAWREDPSGESAILAMSFILPEYRGRGFSRLLYKARLDWARTVVQFKRVVVSHRESNERSRRAIERHGFSADAPRAARLAGRRDRGSNLLRNDNFKAGDGIGNCIGL